MQSVEVREPGKASILTLMLKQILDRNLRDPGKSRKMQGLVLTVRVRSRQMQTTLFFESDRVRAEDGLHGRPDIEIAGTLPVLLSLALGTGPVRAALTREVRLRPMRWRGWVYGLRLMEMMRLADSAPPPERVDRRDRQGGDIP